MSITVSMVESQANAFQPRKLEAAIAYFLKYANNDQLGKMKLMALLYYADFDHFEQYGTPITHACYRKFDHGPVPTEADEMLVRMGQVGSIRHEWGGVGSDQQERYELVIEPDLHLLSAEERATLDQVAKRWEHHSRAQIVNASHGEAPWLAVRHGEDIPYHLAYYRDTYGAMALEDDEYQPTGAEPPARAR